MRLLDRYLLRELLLPLGVCMGGFLVFWVAFDLFSELANLQREHATAVGIAQLYWIRLPDLLGTILPVGELLALLYALTHHARHNELTAMRAAGVGLWRICVPYLVLGLLLSLGSWWINETLLPDAKEREDRLRASWTDPAATIESRQWRTQVNFQNQTDRRAWSLGAFNLATAEMRQPRLSMYLPPEARWEITAETARWTNGYWRLTNGLDLFHRSASDPDPASMLKPFLTTTELGGTLDGVAGWSGGSIEVSNVVVWRTNLVSPTEAGRPSWRIAALSPVTGEVVGLSGGAPVGARARRLIMADAGIWTHGAWRLLNAREFLYRSATDDLPVTLTRPWLDLPELTETPDVIRSEVRVSALLTGTKAAKRPQLSVAEVRNYLRLHPQLPARHRALLDTQLQARLASPWTCLVVVLIAVPFSAPSGRRNVFFGVAGSIGIAFAYFVLQSVGFALGQSGQMAPWLAAWLPNLAFGATGIVLISRVR